MRLKITLYLVAIIVLSYSCSGTDKSKVEDNTKVPIVDFTSIKPLLENDNDTTYIINFWATWCAPCVKEMPHFEKLGQEYSNQKVKIILVNLDFPTHYESRLIPFLEENKIQSQVIMLDDPDANRWINEVDPSWSGSIPATVIYKKNNRKFLEKELSYKELEDAVLSIMNN
jgi:thiol-disulfide isomerase/thioredoxin